MSALAERLAGVVGAEHVDAAGELALAAPADDAQAAELVRLAARDALVVLPLGAGTKRGWTHPPERADFALSTRRIAGVVAYEPGDGTVAARAGTPLADLRATVRAGGHHLTPELADGPATLGGVVAAAQSGFDRLRCGPLRNHVLGVRALLADGNVTKSGGRLVKNVTGYDLHRLYCGSHGSLCVLLEVALRLFPLPDAELVVRAPYPSREAALAAAERVLESHARPVAVTVDGASAPREEHVVEVFLAGRAETIAWERELALSLLFDRSADVETLAGERAASARAAAAGRDGAPGDWPTLVLTCTRSRLAPALAHLDAGLAATGCEARAALHPGVASAHVRIAGLDAERAVRLDAHLAAGPADVQWRAAPEDARDALALLGRPREAALALARRLRDALDPDGRFARGRGAGRV